MKTIFFSLIHRLCPTNFSFQEESNLHFKYFGTSSARYVMRSEMNFMTPSKLKIYLFLCINFIYADILVELCTNIERGKKPSFKVGGNKWEIQYPKYTLVALTAFVQPNQKTCVQTEVSARGCDRCVLDGVCKRHITILCFGAAKFS